MLSDPELPTITSSPFVPWIVPAPTMVAGTCSPGGPHIGSAAAVGSATAATSSIDDVRTNHGLRMRRTSLSATGRLPAGAPAVGGGRQRPPIAAVGQGRDARAEQVHSSALVPWVAS